MKAVPIFLAVLAVLLMQFSAALPHQPENPIMAIFTDPWQECVGITGPINPLGAQCVESFYIRWLATAGIRSVPIQWNATKEHREKILRSVNGVLFPGGGMSSEKLFQEYFGYVKDVVDLAQKWNAKGDRFVVWGTCMGFQVICAALADNLAVIEGGFHGMFPSMLPLYFTKEQPDSRMFGTNVTPAHILNILTTQNSTLNWHHDGVTPATYANNSKLHDAVDVLSTNVDINGREFMSSIEGKNGTAIYATQWHPERPEFEFDNDAIGHTVGDIEVSEYMALWVLSKLKLNNHTFSSPEEAEAHSIHNYPIHNYGEGYELYWLPELH